MAGSNIKSDTMAIDVNKFTININNIKVDNLNPSYQYTGKEIRPDIRVSYNGTLLKLNADYKLSFKDNINSSNVSHLNASIKIEGIGKYKGSVTKYFVISQVDVGRNSPIRIDDHDYILGISKKPIVKFKNSIVLKEGTDYIYRETGKGYKLIETKDKNGSYYLGYNLSYEIEGRGNFKGIKVATGGSGILMISHLMVTRETEAYNYNYLNKQLGGVLDNYIVDLNKTKVNFGRNAIIEGGKTMPFVVEYAIPYSKDTYRLEPDRDFTYINNGNQWIITGKDQFKGTLIITVND